jgi:HEPN superfamily RiboL-PSP-like protein
LGKKTADLGKVSAYRLRLNRLFEKAVGIEDEEMQAEFARYLCVLCSGFLETAIAEVLSAYARNNAGRRVSSYVSSEVGGGWNPWYADIVKTLDQFDAAWADHMRAFGSDKRAEEVNSVVRNRNPIAHGETKDLTLRKLVGWRKSVDEVVDELVRLCLVADGIDVLNWP